MRSRVGDLCSSCFLLGKSNYEECVRMLDHCKGQNQLLRLYHFREFRASRG